MRVEIKSVPLGLIKVCQEGDILKLDEKLNCFIPEINIPTEDFEFFYDGVDNNHIKNTQFLEFCEKDKVLNDEVHYELTNKTNTYIFIVYNIHNLEEIYSFSTIKNAIDFKIILDKRNKENLEKLDLLTNWSDDPIEGLKVLANIETIGDQIEKENARKLFFSPSKEYRIKGVKYIR